MKLRGKGIGKVWSRMLPQWGLGTSDRLQLLGGGQPMMSEGRTRTETPTQGAIAFLIKG